MPSVNPFIDHAEGLIHVTGYAGAAVKQGTLGDSAVAPANQMNAAGTSENVSAHCALIILVALAGIFLLRQGGFRFVVAAGGSASAGISR